MTKKSHRRYPRLMHASLELLPKRSNLSTAMLQSPVTFSPKLRSKNAPPVEVTDLEMGILRALHRYRLLEWRQIQALFGASLHDTKQLAERIELLYLNAYVEVV